MGPGRQLDIPTLTSIKRYLGTLAVVDIYPIAGICLWRLSQLAPTVICLTRSLVYLLPRLAQHHSGLCHILQVIGGDKNYAALAYSWMEQRRWGVEYPLQAVEGTPFGQVSDALTQRTVSRSALLTD